MSEVLAFPLSRHFAELSVGKSTIRDPAAVLFVILSEPRSGESKDLVFGFRKIFFAGSFWFRFFQKAGRVRDFSPAYKGRSRKIVGFKQIKEVFRRIGKPLFVLLVRVRSLF